MNKKVLRSFAIPLVLIFASQAFAQQTAIESRFTINVAGQAEPIPYAPAKTGVNAKIASDLLELQSEFAAYLQTPANRRQDPFTPSTRLMRVSGDYVVVDMLAVNDAEALQNELIALGSLNVSSYGRYVSARVPVSMIDQLAGVKQLQFAIPFYAETRTGSVDSQGDVAQASDVVRDITALPAYTGAGVDIGVMSDSYDCGDPGLATTAAEDIVSGDLPAGGVNVLQEEPGCGSGSDEGRGMLQIVHDVAPGSTLHFNTAFAGITNFANGIGALVTAGADVIVDDVFYFAEPMFQDGAIAQAADAAFAAGVAYFSSAGNSAALSYEGLYSASGFLGPSGFDTHDFDPGPGVDDLQQITVPVGAGFTMSFQWDQPYNNSASDIDIFIVGADGTSVVAAGGASNIGSFALEIVSFDNFGLFDLDGIPGPDTTFYVLIEHFGGPAPDLIKYSINGSGVSIDTYDTASGTSYGHSSAAGAAGVAAAPYFDTPAFGQTPPLQEPFTSRANVPILFDIAGTRLPQPVFRPRPNFTGPDGGNTTFFGNDIGADADAFPNFFGTSASAPHVAAGAALLLEIDPTLTPSQIYSILADSAIDMGTAGFDIDTGTGLVQFDDAEAALANGSPTLEVIASQTGVTSDVLVFNLDATVTADPEGDNISFSQTGMPEPACALTDAGNGTGNITCTLTANEIGGYPIAVSATDDGTPPRSDIQGFYLVANLNNAPTISQIASPQTMDDGDPPLVLDFSAADVNTGDTLSFGTGVFPVFCTFDAADPNGPDTAQLSCDPGYNNSGAYILSVTASDDGVPVRAAATTFVLGVNNVNRDPTLNPIGPQQVDEGAQIIINATATDLDVPDALTLDANEPDFCIGVDNGDGTGSLTCDPTFADAGSYPITVTVTDAFSGTDFETFTLTVDDVNQPPVLDFIGNHVVANDSSLIINLSSSDPDGNAVTLSGAVPGFCIPNYTGATGTITCTPTGAGDNGTYPVTVTATDNGVGPLTDDETFDIVVGGSGTLNNAPVLSPIGNQSVADTDVLVIPLSATDADGDTMTFVNSTGLPVPCVLTDGNGVGDITCTPSFGDEGVYPITVRVTDSGTPNLSDAETINITVTRVNVDPVADAGPDQSVPTVATVFLDGSGSSDFETAALDLLFSWRFVAIPPTSTMNDTGIFDRFTAGPSFIADVDGTYILELSVTDEASGVDVDTVTVVADNPRLPFFGDSLNPRIDLRDPATGLSSSTGGAGYTFWVGGIGVELVEDVPAVTVDPTTNVAYAAVRRTGQAGSELVTFDPFSAVAVGNADGTPLGDMGDVVFGLDFDSDGTLYAITADDATPNVVAPETLFTVDKTDGSMTLVMDLDNGGATGEAIAFNRDTGILYHSSGTVFESVDIGGLTTTSIGYSGDMPGTYVVDGLTYDVDRGLLVGTRRDAGANAQAFFSVTDAGVVADITTGQPNFVWQDLMFWDLSFQVPTSLAASGDHSGDGNADILFRNTNDGQNALWEMTGGTRDANSAVDSVNTNWSVVGDGDYNGDGFQDILWRSNTGAMAIWLMQGGEMIANLALPTVSDTNWVVVGDGDHNGDGESDVLWRNMFNGQNALWQINGGSVTANLSVLTVSNLDWTIVGDGDYTGDGKADILWRNTDNGQNALWAMDGASREFNLLVQTVSNLDWTVVGDGDQNGDGMADILWRNTANGQNALWTMNGANMIDNLAVPAVTNQLWKVVGNRDYDGDGMSDILWHHETLGYVVFWKMSSGSMQSNILVDTVSDTDWGVVNLK